MAKTKVQNDQRKKRGQYGASLTNNQRLFVQYYSGNAMDAARMAGYADPQAAGWQLMKNMHVMAALRYKQMHPEAEGVKPTSEPYAETSPIATRNEILIGLTEIARDAQTDVREKIKAYELLGKAIALWVTKVEVDQNSYEERLKQILAEENEKTRSLVEDLIG